MELWIRGQDKTKITKPILIKLDNNKTNIFGYYSDDYYEVLGKYKTEERALEVLDDIHNVLKGNVENHINKFDLYRDNNVIIYEMPKE